VDLPQFLGGPSTRRFRFCDGALQEVVQVKPAFSTLQLKVWQGLDHPRPVGSLTFRWVKAPTGAELSALGKHIASRVGRFLERQGLLQA
jgi:hypothetical protein